MKTKGIWILGMIGVAALLYSCYPFPEEARAKSDLDTVISNFKEDVDFTSFTRYVLYDSVAVLSNDGEDVGPDDPFYTTGLDSLILAEVEAQMNALGYMRVNANQGPQIGVVATALSATNTVVTSPGWWWSYPGYGWWWQGGGYPFLGSSYLPGWYANYYEYSQGSVVLDMVDLNPASDEEAFIWNAIVNGLLDESQTSSGAQRIQDGVRSAFQQSRNFYPREPNSN